MRRTCALLALALLAEPVVSGCKPPPARNGQVSARVYRYDDDDGLTVTTGALAAQQELGSNIRIRERYWVDRVAAEPKAPIAPAENEHDHNTFQSVPVRVLQEHSGHSTPDVVTSASTTVARGRAAQEFRHEGLVAAEYRNDRAAVPMSFELLGRASTEPDYTSRSVNAAGSFEFFERNTVLTANIGRGWDTIEPLEAPPGQEEAWPASHSRWALGLGLTQLLSPELTISLGISTSFQSGQLANPYRRALVRTTLFSEVVPDERDRYVAFVAMAYYLGAQTALHLRQGIYLDSWGVKAFIPEAALAKHFSGRLLLRLGVRHYRQAAADFYEQRYDTIEPWLSADPRLGRIRDNAGFVELEWTVIGAYREPGSLNLEAGLNASVLRYIDLEKTVISRIPYLGVSVAY